MLQAATNLVMGVANLASQQSINQQNLAIQKENMEQQERFNKERLQEARNKTAYESEQAQVARQRSAGIQNPNVQPGQYSMSTDTSAPQMQSVASGQGIASAFGQMSGVGGFLREYYDYQSSSLALQQRNVDLRSSLNDVWFSDLSVADVKSAQGVSEFLWNYFLSGNNHQGYNFSIPDNFTDDDITYNSDNLVKYIQETILNPRNKSHQEFWSKYNSNVPYPYTPLSMSDVSVSSSDRSITLNRQLQNTVFLEDLLSGGVLSLFSNIDVSGSEVMGFEHLKFSPTAQSLVQPFLSNILLSSVTSNQLRNNWSESDKLYFDALYSQYSASYQNYQQQIAGIEAKYHDKLLVAKINNLVASTHLAIQSVEESKSRVSVNLSNSSFTRSLRTAQDLDNYLKQNYNITLDKFMQENPEDAETLILGGGYRDGWTYFRDGVSSAASAVGAFGSVRKSPGRQTINYDASGNVTGSSTVTPM